MFMSRSTSLEAPGPRRDSRTADFAPSQPTRREPVAEEPSEKVAVMDVLSSLCVIDWSCFPY